MSIVSGILKTETGRHITMTEGKKEKQKEKQRFRQNLYQQPKVKKEESKLVSNARKDMSGQPSSER